MFARRYTNGNLEAALAQMLQNQAQLLQNQAQFVAQVSEDRQRFARIEKDLDLIKALLIKHEEKLEKLTDAIREKIGFKPS